MELLSPASLAWLGLLGPLVLLYVLKRRREARVVGSTLLWEQALRDLRAERPWKKLIPHLSLLLQALVLIAGAVALARPAGAGQIPQGARLAVIVDTSASMAAREADGRSRLDHAKSAARALARSLPPGGTMMLVEAGAEAAVLAPATSDGSILERAIDRLRTRGSGAGIEGAVALAAERLRDASAGSRIVVLTDAAIDGDVVLAGGVPVEVQRVGAAGENTAIVAIDVRARPSEESPDRAEIFARLVRFGTTDAEVWVSAIVEGRGVVASRRVRVAPDRAEGVVMLADLPPDASGRAAVVRVELASDEEGTHGTGDALSLDDVAVAPSPGARRLPVFLVGDAPESIRRVLLADRDVELFATSPEALAQRRADDPDAPDLDGLLVFAGATPDAPPSGARLAADALAIAPTGDAALGVTLGPEATGPAIVSWDEGDPRLRFVSFRDVRVASARPITGASARPIVTSEAGPIVAVLERPDGEATIVAFDPDRSDWPRGPGFVVFVRNLLERVRARRAAGGIAPGAIGEPLRVPAADGETVVVRAPDGSSSSATARGGVAIVDVPAVPGTYQAEVGRRRVHALRNLLSSEESDVRPRARFVSREGGAEVSASERREPREAWPWLAAALLVILAIEVVWATRKGAA
ncbi:vWA domain-containing protein [Sandaracinus amylolyticus]|nr:VWA domain-containing protein [Sandaracinus amylolyticus]